MNAKIIDQSFQPLYGKPCWGMHYLRLLNLSMNFGKPWLQVREPYRTDSKSEFIQRLATRRDVTVQGEWWLWIYCSHWRLTSNGILLATGASSLRRIQRATAMLEGQKLVSVHVEPNTAATRFTFDLGSVLDCRRFKPDNNDLWILSEARGSLLSVCGNGTLHRHRCGWRRSPICLDGAPSRAGQAGAKLLRRDFGERRG
jgi:hypothetical protein